MSGFPAPSVPVDAMTVAATGQDPHDRLAALLSGPSVTILGTRSATGYGEHLAMSLGAHLAQADVTVVTVLTYGIANAAARGALMAGGRVVLVSPSGVNATDADRGLPQLVESVEKSGARVSFVPDEQVSSKTSFRDAHRLAVAIGGALVVPEAAASSVATEFAAGAHGAGRLVYAMPGPVTSKVSDGPHALIRAGQATLITGPDAIPLGDLFSYPPVVRTH